MPVPFNKTLPVKYPSLSNTFKMYIGHNEFSCSTLNLGTAYAQPYTNSISSPGSDTQNNINFQTTLSNAFHKKKMFVSRFESPFLPPKNGQLPVSHPRRSVECENHCNCFHHLSSRNSRCRFQNSTSRFMVIDNTIFFHFLTWYSSAVEANVIIHSKWLAGIKCRPCVP